MLVANHFFLKYLSLLLFLFSLGGCTSSNYIQHVPVEGNHQRLQEQYDLKFSGSLLNGIFIEGKDLNNSLQISFSPIKNFGLQVARSSSNNYGTFIDSWKGALGGYYFFESEQKNRRRKRKKRSNYLLSKGLLIDLYSGVESKKMNQKGVEKNGIGEALLNARNLFLEGGVQYQSKHFGIGSTFKLNSIQFKQGIYNLEVNRRYTSPQIQINQLLDYFLIIKNNNGRYNFMEGSIYLIAGDKRINFHAGYHRNFQSINDSFRTLPHIAYAGLNLNIDTFYDSYLKKKKRKKARKKKK